MVQAAIAMTPQLPIWKYWQAFARPAAVAVAAALVAGCQGTFGATPTISLEEAKKVTAEFSRDFVPPPRSIGDVLAKLKSYDPGEPSCENRMPLSDAEIRRYARNIAPGSQATQWNLAPAISALRRSAPERSAPEKSYP